MRRKFALVWQCNLFRTLLLLLFSLLTNCVHQPLASVLPAGIEITPLSLVESTVFAVDSAGEELALTMNGLQVLDAETGVLLWRDARTPLALAWSGDGQQLAAVFVEGAGRERLVIFSQQGRAQSEQVIDGSVVGLGFVSDGLLVAVVDWVHSYRFGEHHEIRLVRWDGKSVPTVAILGSTTVEPASLTRFGSILNGSQWVDFSPWGDEILFTRLHDPPAADPYCELVVRHLESGRERILARVKIAATGGRFSRGGESVVYDDGEGTLWELGLWTGESRKLSLKPEAYGEIAARGQFIWTGSRFFEKDLEMFRFANAGAGTFIGDGCFYFIHHNRLLRLSGLDLTDVPVHSAKFLRLRAWRAAGLVTPQEFDEQQGGVGP